MITEKIIVANMKCSGCAHSIQSNLNKIKGVEAIQVDLENDAVDVTYDTAQTRIELIKRLQSMGYPEATEENGLLLQLKSYANCMIGRITKEKEQNN